MHLFLSLKMIIFFCFFFGPLRLIGAGPVQGICCVKKKPIVYIA